MRHNYPWNQQVKYYEKDYHHPHTGSVWWLPMKGKSQLNSKKKRKTPTVSEFESKLSQTFGHKSLLSADKLVTWVENVWPFAWLKFQWWLWLIKLRSAPEQHTQMVSGTKRVLKVKQKLGSNNLLEIVAFCCHILLPVPTELHCWWWVYELF